MIYLDYAATCPCDPRVVRAMAGAWSCGNTASKHVRGEESKKRSIAARKKFAKAIGAKPREIVWTSGATEADNLAIKGWVEAEVAQEPHVFAPATEHKAVLRSLEVVAGWGAATYVLPVDSSGRLDLDEVASVLDDRALLSVMLVNNETGVIQPIAELARLCREAGALLHCDATQALGRLPIDVGALDVDMASFSAHKVCGPKGIGALWVREGVELTPQICGGAQEDGRRAGTTPVPLCVGFAEAAHIATKMLDAEHARIGKLRALLFAELERRGVDHHVNGAGAPMVPAICSVAFPGADPDRLIEAVTKDLCVSIGSACNEGKPSHVLEAMGVPSDLAVLRITIGRWTKRGDIMRAAGCIARSVRKASA